jgi:colicin import membrane protein
MTNNNESVTINTTSTLNAFLSSLEAADFAESARFYETEKAINLLKLLRGQYATLQDGRSKDKEAAAGELPAVIYLSVIEGMYNKKKAFAEVENQEFTLKYESYRDFQVRQLKYYIETGELLNNKKSTLQERAAVKIDKLEKQAKAEAAKLAKAAEAKAKAEAAKAEAEAKAAEAKAKADALLADAQEAADAMDENGGVEEFLILADAQEAAADDAQEAAAEAKAKAEAEAAAAKAEAEAAAKAKAAADKLAEAKAKAKTLSAGKADNKKTEPSLNFKTTNFSQDCKDTAQMILTELENDASAPELLYLAKLILDKYNK